MDKLRVFQNVKNKRAVTGFSLQNLGTVLLLILFLPYIITLLAGNLWKEEGNIDLMVEKQLLQSRYEVINQTLLGRETVPLDLYVADVLARTMGEAYETEALKAQAILIRTNLLQGEKTQFSVTDSEYGKRSIPENCLLAAAETRGICLVYEGKPVYGAYFKVSNGSTRDAGQVLMNEEYPYLQGVSCEKDFLSKEHTDIKVFSVYQFEKKWENVPEIEVKLKEDVQSTSLGNGFEIRCLRDDAGYVLFACYQGKWVMGENLRYEFALNSSDFYVQLQNNEIIFTTKGNGHGLGMSQFGANEMAKEGKDYMEILTYFFKNTTLTKIE